MTNRKLSYNPTTYDSIQDAPRTEEFVVTVERVIGTVRYGEGGEDSPYQAAFKLIAEEGESGHYGFPLSDGGHCFVDVTHGELRDKR